MQGQTSSYVLTTLVTAPASSALTTLANVKDELDIPSTDTSNDNRLTRFIAEESASIARYCNRIFGLATWQDEFRPQKGVRGEGVRAAANPLQLTRWPLTTAAVAFTGNTHSNLLIDSIASTAGLRPGMPVFGLGVPVAAVIASVMPTGIMLSKPATVSALAVAITAGLSVVETIGGTSTQLVAGIDFEVETGSLLAGDEGASQLYRLNQLGHPRTWPPGQIVVIYQAGYALPNDSNPVTPVLPADLSSVCIRLVVWRFRARGRDPMLRAKTQPNLGAEQYWVGATPGQRGPYPNDIMSVLDNYRTPVVA